MSNVAASMKELPAGTAQTAVGSRPMSFFGWRIPAHYGDPEAEYAAAQRCGVVDLSFLTKVAALGADRADYLNRRLSQKLDDMAPPQTRRATLLGAEGRMEADVEIVAEEGEWHLLSTPATSGDTLAAQFDRYVFTEDARFEDRTERDALFAILGTEAERLSNLPVPSRGEWIAGTMGAASVRIWHSDFAGGAPTLRCSAAHAAAVWESLVSAARARGGGAVGWLPFDTVRIERGIAWWGIDTNEKSIPLDAHLGHAVHDNKGCYPGQETIAKIRNLGHPARQLVGVEFDGEDPPAPRTALLTKDGAAAGEVTSAAFRPSTKRAIALAMVKWPWRGAGTELVADNRRGIVMPLPFPNPPAG